MKAIVLLSTSSVVAIHLLGCTAGGQNNFAKLYDHYFPRNAGGVESSVYRRSFDETLFGPPPTEKRSRAHQLYYAFRGDATAFHAFVNNADWEVNGVQGEECVYECVLLLLRLGDDRFSQLLAMESPRIRNRVGYAIDPHIDWTKHQFQKTRALYSYRYVRTR